MSISFGESWQNSMAGEIFVSTIYGLLATLAFLAVVFIIGTLCKVFGPGVIVFFLLLGTFSFAAWLWRN